MKKIFCYLILAALAVPAFAQVPTFAPQTLGGIPSTLATTIGTNFASTGMPLIDISKQGTLAVCITFNQSGASTSNVFYWWAPTVDGITYDTNNLKVFSIPSKGTGVQIAITNNLPTAGLKGWGLYAISNDTALTTWTNKGITYGIKISAP